MRVWQLSQQAVSGMLAGLLKQPRGRGAQQMAAIPPEDDPKILKKRIKELEHKLKLTEDILEILREFPPTRPAPAAAQNPRTVEGSASRETKTQARGKKTDRTSPPRGQATDRESPLGPGSSTSAG